MTVQTTYTKEAQIALPGLIYDLGNTNIDSFAAEGTVSYGRFVSRGTDPQNQVIMDGDAAAIGVSVRTAKENTLGGDAATMIYDDTETVGVLRSGFIWCEFDAVGGSVDADVTIDSSGKVVAAGGGTALTAIAATIEKPAVAIQIGSTTMYVGLVNVKG